MKYLKKIIMLGILSIIISATCIVWADTRTENYAHDKVYDSIKDIPYNKVGLLLGTGKKISNNRINLYYQYRIDAAVDLFNSGKIENILVSGDNSTKGYDEPTVIKEDLMIRGIPAEKIALDFAGFRTLDSVVRSNAIFGQESITIISQKFHNERGIYIASWKGIKAVGYNARDVSRKYGFKTRVRERLARVKMMIDLLFGKKPKFLGEQILIK